MKIQNIDGNKAIVKRNIDIIEDKPDKVQIRSCIDDKISILIEKEKKDVQGSHPPFSVPKSQSDVKPSNLPSNHSNEEIKTDKKYNSDAEGSVFNDKKPGNKNLSLIISILGLCISLIVVWRIYKELTKNEISFDIQVVDELNTKGYLCNSNDSTNLIKYYVINDTIEKPIIYCKKINWNEIDDFLNINDTIFPKSDCTIFLYGTPQKSNFGKDTSCYKRYVFHLAPFIESLIKSEKFENNTALTQLFLRFSRDYPLYIDYDNQFVYECNGTTGWGHLDELKNDIIDENCKIDSISVYEEMGDKNLKTNNYPQIRYIRLIQQKPDFTNADHKNVP